MSASFHLCHIIYAASDGGGRFFDPAVVIKRKRFVLEEGSGQWVVALIVSETPLPSYREWLALHPNMPWRTSESKKGYRSGKLSQHVLRLERASAATCCGAAFARGYRLVRLAKKDLLARLNYEFEKAMVAVGRQVETVGIVSGAFFADCDARLRR